jgi:Leucine-rich repeat (LRR) protein
MISTAFYAASVQIYNNDISGPIPSSIGRLTDLRTLDLNANALTSSLPSELAGLSKLETLNVMKNIELSGPFFEPFGMAWPNLRHLVLDETLLNGTIAPDAVARWNNSLETLSIRDTMIAGIIPSAIQELHKLKSLNLVGPAFQGSFPALTHLLQLRKCGLCGGIPETKARNNLLTSLPTLFRGDAQRN